MVAWYSKMPRAEIYRAEDFDNRNVAVDRRRGACASGGYPKRLPMRNASSAVEFRNSPHLLRNISTHAVGLDKDAKTLM